nr:Calx-beta domain-containing protein [Desulfobacterales bacterium]
MKPTLTSIPKKALLWIIAGLLIALMPSVALAADLIFTISAISTTSVSETSPSNVEVRVESIGDPVPPGVTGTVNFILTEVGPNGAVEGVDYTHTGNLTFDFGDPTFKIFSITPVNDNIVEPDKTFNIEITNASVSTTEATGTATVFPLLAPNVTITSEDTATITISDESDSEATGSADFTVTVDNPVEGGFSVTYGVDVSGAL